MNDGQPDQSWAASAFVEYEGRLLAYARRITRCEQRAHDVVQDTFLKLCRQDRGQINGQLAQWLYTVCRNQALDVRRKEARMIATAEEILTQLPQTGESSDPPPEIGERCDAIAAAVERLPDKQRICVRLKFQEGLSYREIADRTGLTESNVGFLIHASIKELRSRFARPTSWQ